MTRPGVQRERLSKEDFFFFDYQFHFTWTFENQYRPKTRTWPPVEMVTLKWWHPSYLGGWSRESTGHGAAEMALWLRALVLEEIMGLIPSTQMVQKHL